MESNLEDPEQGDHHKSLDRFASHVRLRVDLQSVEAQYSPPEGA